MEVPFDEGSFRRRLEALSPPGRLAFLLSCAERLFPNYLAFHKHHGWGKPEALQRALDLGWAFLAGEKVGDDEVKATVMNCEAVTPDTEDFESEYVSAGLDAAVCCAFVLEVVLKDDPQKVVEAASLARDTVDMYVQNVESLHPQDAALEEKILRHQLVQRELQRQREDLNLLLQAPAMDRATVADLAGRWRRPAVSNIGRVRTAEF